MIALMDGDLLLYKVGFVSEDVDINVAVRRMDEMIEGIIKTTNTNSYNIYLSDSRDNTFRAKLCPDYKANRQDQQKPTHYDELKIYLINEWNAEVAVEEEADDMLGKTQNNQTIICSGDKDLLQIPGHHYVLPLTRKGELIREGTFCYVTPEEGRLHFYKQLLTGDRVDNIQGIKGIGPAKAAKLLDSTLESDELTQFQLVQDAYRDWLQGEWEGEWDRFKEKQLNNIIIMNGRLLKIRTYEGEVWQPPNFHDLLL